MNTEEMKQEIVRWAKREVELAHREQAVEAEAGAAMLDVDSGGDTPDRRDSGLAELRAIAAAVREAQRRRMEASVHLIKALGGGWNSDALPSLKALEKDASAAQP